jgi:hypothetical protein
MFWLQYVDNLFIGQLPMYSEVRPVWDMAAAQGTVQIYIYIYIKNADM